MALPYRYTFRSFFGFSYKGRTPQGVGNSPSRFLVALPEAENIVTTHIYPKRQPCLFIPMPHHATPKLLSLLLLLQYTCSRSAYAYNFSACQSEALSGAYGLDGLVDQYGNPVSFLNQTEGLRYQQCLEYCDNGIEVNNWATISDQVTGWLLPWLALTAQLPFSTTDRWQDLRSVLLVVGSPILAMYSLLLSLFNAEWAKDKCDRVARSVPQGTGVRDHMNDVGLALAACQHVPLEINEDMLLCSIRLKENEQWWEDLSKSLRNMGRGFPASLWAQMGLAAVSFAITIVNAFSSVGGFVPLWLSRSPSRLRKRQFGDWNTVDLDSTTYFWLVCSTHTVHSTKHSGCV